MRSQLQGVSLQMGGLLVAVKKAMFLSYTQTRAAQVKATISYYLFLYFIKTQNKS